jgi:ATP-dependent RNA helicase DHX29
VDARVGKLLLLSACLGCLAPALTIAACLSYKSPFASGPEHADAADRARAALAAPGSGTLAAGHQSDHLVMAAAFQGWAAARQRGGAKAAREFARAHSLGEQTLEMLSDMRGQFASMLSDIGFVPRGGGGGGGGRGWVDDPSLPANRYASHPAVVKGALLAALYPNLAVMDDAEAGPGRRPAWHDGGGDVAIHPSSLCHPLEAARFHRPFLTFLEKVRTSKVYVRDCTVVSPAAILLFGGRLEVEHEAARVRVDGWIRIRAAPAVAVAVKRLRRALEALLRRKVAAPRGAEGAGEEGGAVVAAIAELLDHEEAAQGWALGT